MKTNGRFVTFIEARPLEKGRRAVVFEAEPGQLVDLSPSDFNVRTRVHEYGGGEYTVGQSVLVFSDFSSQRLYLKDLISKEVKAVTNDSDSKLRYADGVLVDGEAHLICVLEDHRNAEEKVGFSCLNGCAK